MYHAQAAVRLSCGYLLLFGCAVQYLARQFDLQWVRLCVPLFLAIRAWIVLGISEHEYHNDKRLNR